MKKKKKETYIEKYGAFVQSKNGYVVPIDL